MYLVSLYFDEKTNQKISSLMECAATRSGNTDMIDKHVPPHITLAAFESRESEEMLIGALDRALSGLEQGDLMWVSVAAFFPHVLFLAPVPGEYLQGLSQRVCNELTTCGDTQMQDCYRPHNWLPHTTVARRLSEEQMLGAFAALQKAFSPFKGTVVRIGLSTGSPKRELETWDLR